MKRTPLRIRYLRHVPFEDPGYILTWAGERGQEIAGTRLYSGEPLPDRDSFDWLLIMGGPMSTTDEDRYPWLAGEKRFIRESIHSGKIVLGVCLGAQLIAEALGGTVFRNDHKEIGWFPVRLTPEGRRSAIYGDLPAEFTAFHWHGDTFTLPPGCARIAESDATLQQAFEYKGRVFGLQFHLESTAAGIQALLENCGADLRPGRFVQNAESIRSEANRIHDLNFLAAALLDRMGALDI
jgi:GMP synthase-like glutamine amidotransferase